MYGCVNMNMTVNVLLLYDAWLSPNPLYLLLFVFSCLIQANNPLVVRPAGERRAAPQNNNDEEPKLYVGMLSRETVPEEIERMFEVYGKVKEVYLMRDRNTGRSKGSAFVRFYDRESAISAVNALNERVRDKNAPGYMQVRFAQARSRAPPGGMRYGAPYGQQQQHGYGAVPNYGARPGMYGYGAPPMGRPGYGAPVPGVAPGAPGAYGMPASPIGSQTNGPFGANLFIFGLPEEYSDADLLALFQSFGVVVSCKVLRDNATGSSKGCGFVSFDNVESASQAIQLMDSYQVGHKRLSVRHKKGT
jgi:CUG-BP- and ETR3-like factor